MSFLAPAFLLGLVALVVPIIVHLIQRERKYVVVFPSLMFIRRIPYQSVRRRRIRNWFLLFMRLVALTLIVAAFARPFVKRQGLAAVAMTGGAREVVVLLDRSYSMGYGDNWNRARAEARRAVANLGSDDRATLILFSTAAEVAVRSTAERDGLLAEIDRAKLSAGATRYGPALKLTQSILAESQLPRKEAILISDFQKTGWKRDEDVRLPAGAVLTPVSVAATDTSNVTVASAAFERAPFSGRERVSVSAGLVNRSSSAVSTLDVTLEIDGRDVQTERASLGANAATSVTFAPFTLAAAGTRGTVRISKDKLAQDNAFYFVLSPGEPVPILIIERAGASADASLYLARALAIGTTPAFGVEVRPVERVVSTDFNGRSVVILNDVAPPSTAFTTAVQRFVDGGGGVLMVLGERGGWPTEGPDLLPATLGAAVDRTTGRGGTLGTIDYSHPVFELFKAARSGDFSAAHFFRYRSVAVHASASVLARFDDGAVALAERRVGQGRVLLWTSTLDNFWNDLAVKPVFLPFIHRAVTYLARYTEPTAWLTVGQVIDAGSGDRRAGGTGRGAVAGGRGPGRPATGFSVALSPSGERIRLDSGDRGGVLELAEQGFYQLRAQGEDGKPPLDMAANLDLSESDLSPVDPQELVASVTGRTPTGGVSAGVEQLKPEDQEKRQKGWWYMLFAVVILLAAETAVSNRLSGAGD